ncbi:hypothetical protein HHK36_026576 [Tetracentron sinense]|uniref:RNase H type-1 domain-containing protein n=1 Tax=Tetracentron sinense TaxID=13715 RepID=A0A834YFA6_TETSI|nr:hypothetical protein HHK36_026576 [Tetracentron sinense]
MTEVESHDIDFNETDFPSIGDANKDLDLYKLEEDEVILPSSSEGGELVSRPVIAEDNENSLQPSGSDSKVQDQACKVSSGGYIHRHHFEIEGNVLLCATKDEDKPASFCETLSSSARIVSSKPVKLRKKGRALFEEIKARGFVPDVPSYSILIHGLVKAGLAGFRKVLVESDPECSVLMIKEGMSEFHPNLGLVAACKYLMKQDWDCNICHIYRKANFSTDGLANFSGSHGPGLRVHDSPPVGLILSLVSDVSGAARPGNVLV